MYIYVVFFSERVTEELHWLNVDSDPSVMYKCLTCTDVKIVEEAEMQLGYYFKDDLCVVTKWVASNEHSAFNITIVFYYM